MRNDWQKTYAQDVGEFHTIPAIITSCKAYGQKKMKLMLVDSKIIMKAVFYLFHSNKKCIIPITFRRTIGSSDVLTL